MRNDSSLSCVLEEIFDTAEPTTTGLNGEWNDGRFVNAVFFCQMMGMGIGSAGSVIRLGIHARSVTDMVGIWNGNVESAMVLGGFMSRRPHETLRMDIAGNAGRSARGADVAAR